jgi:N-acetyl-gamma-glutamyl-phosphate reductase
VFFEGPELAREKTMSSNKTKIFIDGQHGTTGLQILDRLKDRPDIELLELPMAERKDLAKRAEIARASDITVLCLPDAAAKELVAALGDADTVVIDASTAHRVADGWTYGFPELTRQHRQKLLESKRISNPGCYPTGGIAILRPLVDAGLIRADSTPAVFGVSGYTGGGKELIAVHEKPDVEPFGLYGMELTHKHVPEMKKYSGLQHAPLFVPSVGHYAQGMLVIVPITRDITAKKIEAADVQQVLEERYAGETFVTVRPFADRGWLERERFLRADRLVDTNSMELAVYANPAEEQILAVASLDNLGKGASGAAVQTINLKTGVDEATGLTVG